MILHSWNGMVYDRETGKFTNLTSKQGSKIPPGGEITYTNGRYKQLSLNRKKYLQHRVAWKLVHGEWPEVIDHINGDTMDNRICNLRNTTQAGNQRNVRKSSSNTGVVGVHFQERRGTYEVCITDENGNKKRTTEHDLLSAVATRIRWEREHNYRGVFND